MNQLGNNSTTRQSSPIRIGTAANRATIGAGHYHSLATRTDGTLWAWGVNSYCQLGDGATDGRHIPTLIIILKHAFPWPMFLPALTGAKK